MPVACLHQMSPHALAQLRAACAGQVDVWGKGLLSVMGTLLCRSLQGFSRPSRTQIELESTGNAFKL